MKTICLVALLLVAVASAAPRKVIVRRQAGTAKTIVAEVDKDVGVKPKEGIKDKGSEEGDERFGIGGFGSAVQANSQFQTHSSSSSVQQAGFARPIVGGLGVVQPGFGQTGFGQTGFGQLGFNQNGLGQAGLGQTGLGQTGFVQSGLGQSTFGRPVGSGFIGK